MENILHDFEEKVISLMTEFLKNSMETGGLSNFTEDLKDNLLIELNNNEVESLSKEYFMELLEILIDHIDCKREIYSAILSHNKNGIFVDFLIDVVNRDLAKRLKDSQEVIKSNIPADIISKFYLGGIINIGVDWIINKDKYNKTQILLYLDKLIPDKL